MRIWDQPRLARTLSWDGKQGFEHAHLLSVRVSKLLCPWAPLKGPLHIICKEAAMKILASILTRRALLSCCSRWAVADCGHVDGGPGGGIVEEHEAWAVSIQRVAGRLATPLGHIKKKK